MIYNIYIRGEILFVYFVKITSHFYFMFFIFFFVKKRIYECIFYSKYVKWYDDLNILYHVLVFFSKIKVLNFC